MIELNGKTLIKDLRATLPRLSRKVTLGILLVGDNPQSLKYIGIKQARAQDYGIETCLVTLLAETSTEQVLDRVKQLNQDADIDSLIVQLPLPGHIDTEAVLAALNPTKDVDNLSGVSNFVSPMVQAVDALRRAYGLEFENKSIVVVGYGRLIGQPIVAWLNEQGIKPTVVEEHTAHSNHIIRQADVIIAGTGQRGIINANNTREGQVIINCAGPDVDYDTVAPKAAAITPTVGGIGPLTVHFLLANCLVVGQS